MAGYESNTEDDQQVQDAHEPGDCAKQQAHPKRGTSQQGPPKGDDAQLGYVDG